MDSVTIGTHGSDLIEFKVAPYEIGLSWWDSLAWWQKALIIATGIVSVGGAVYVGTRRK